MRRRPFLAAAGTTLVLSGCLDSDGTSPNRTGTTMPSEPPTRSGTASKSAGDGPNDASSGAFSVTNLSTRTFDYALRLNDLGPVPRGGVRSLEDLDGEERAVVTAATEGTYETDAVPDWLARFADSTRFVATADAVYELEYDLPTYTITATETDRDDVEGAIADTDTYRAAVTHDGVVMSGLVRIAAREGLTFHYVWDGLESLVTDYAAVEYQGNVYELDVSTDDPGAPYTITATAPSVEDLVDGAVATADEQPAVVRKHLVAAAETDGIYAVDDAPDELFGVVETHRYVHHDGRFYAAYVEKDGSVPVDVVAELGEPTAEGVPTLELGLQNDGTDAVSVSTGPPRPLGVLSAEPVGGAEGVEARRTLWSDAYAESDHVHVEDGDVRGVNAIALITDYAPGERRTDVYALQGEPAAGTYRVRETVGVESHGETLPFEVRFDVTDP